MLLNEHQREREITYFSQGEFIVVVEKLNKEPFSQEDVDHALQLTQSSELLQGNGEYRNILDFLQEQTKDSDISGIRDLVQDFNELSRFAAALKRRGDQDILQQFNAYQPHYQRTFHLRKQETGPFEDVTALLNELNEQLRHLMTQLGQFCKTAILDEEIENLLGELTPSGIEAAEASEISPGTYMGTRLFQILDRIEANFLEPDAETFRLISAALLAEEAVAELTPEKIVPVLSAALENLSRENVMLVGQEAHILVQIKNSGEPIPLRDQQPVMAYFISEVDYQIQRGIVEISNKEQQIKVTGISPNWLSSNSQGNMTGGGPGGRPVPPKNPDGNDIQLEDYQFSVANMSGKATSWLQQLLIAICRMLFAINRTLGKAFSSFLLSISIDDLILLTEAMQQTDCSKPVDVYILDTILDAAELSGRAPAGNAFLGSVAERVQNQGMRQYPNSLGESVFSNMSHGTAYGIKNHDYKMPDHGFFIASIIHSLTKNVNLHLYQILNDWGVGSIFALTWAVEQVAMKIRRRENPSIVNCSFTFVPDDATFCWNLFGVGNLFCILNSKLPVTICSGRVGDDIAKIFRPLLDRAIIIAAAGNDTVQENDPEETRFPAALAGVIGVGALEAPGDVAEYSNIADEQPQEGFLAIGGKVTDHRVWNRVAHTQKGLLGSYTQGFPLPDGTAPPHVGWARWAGTSFATGVVTGTYARLLSCGKSLSDIDNLLRTTEAKGRNAHYLHIKQGR